MPNLAEILKSEIARLARKEVRGEVAFLKKASTQQRAQIASLRLQVDAQEREIKKALNGLRPTRQVETAGAEEGAEALRFRASGLASHRKRLGLSPLDLGKLLGVSSQSVYKWESGAVRPRRSQLDAIAAVRKLGRREALARLFSVA
jgi:DNA-binding transcriptional regulator YiaG